MARLTREESQALTRAKLLANAVRVVAAEGYEGASIDKIAEAAGYSKGAFYSNFASKEELFLELLETHAGQDVVEIARLLDGVSVPAAIIDRFCEWADSRASDPTWGFDIQYFRFTGSCRTKIKRCLLVICTGKKLFVPSCRSISRAWRGLSCRVRVFWS